MKRKSATFIRKNLVGKTIVFTGGTDGMGRIAVTKLAEMGASLMILGRNKQKTEKVVEDLNEIVGTENSKYVQCDLASLSSVRNAAKEILESCPRIDYLINCAGAQPGLERKLSKDGYELNWAINHLGPFLLTNLLVERLKISAPAKIVNLSSATEKNAHIHLDDLQLTKNYSVLNAYPQAKLAMNMCTRKMAKELAGTGVFINALNPGHIKTNLGRDLSGWAFLVGKPYTFFFGEKTEFGASRIIHLALSDEFDNVSGKFIYEDYIKNPNSEALDDELVERVWNISNEHVGL